MKALSTVNSPVSRHAFKGTLIGLGALLCLATSFGMAYAQDPAGVNNQISTDTGVSINGGANGSNISNTQNNLSTGSNANYNLTNVNPNINTSIPLTTNGGVGGNAVMMLPRNPLPLSNALLGRSNFGLQFGVQNNPILGSLGNGGQGALGWFLQGGVTIPFGKIPEPFLNQQASMLDDMRRDDMQRRRAVFGNVSPNANSKAPYQTKVQGRVVGMGAYNYATVPTGKLALPAALGTELPASVDLKQAPARLVALAPADVYAKPLNAGEKVGLVEVGAEYPYLGHVSSGWIKVLLPSGKPGWTNARFEYVKSDFTDVDSLVMATDAKTTASATKSRYGRVAYSGSRYRRAGSRRYTRSVASR